MPEVSLVELKSDIDLLDTELDNDLLVMVVFDTFEVDTSLPTELAPFNVYLPEFVAAVDEDEDDGVVAAAAD